MLVAVIGPISPHREQSQLAAQLGRALAERHHLLLIDDSRGVCGAAARAAKAAGGVVLGITHMRESASEYDIQLPTGMGPMRTFFMVSMADALIAVGGGPRTLAAIAFASVLDKRIAVMRGSGGWSDRLADTALSEKGHNRIPGASNVDEALKVIGCK